MTEQLKLCIDCKWQHRRKCYNPKYTQIIISRIDGEDITDYFSCGDLRWNPDHCGKDAIGFEPKPTLFERIKRIFRND